MSLFYRPISKEILCGCISIFAGLAIHTKVLKTTRDAAEEDYKYLVQDFQPFPRDGTVSKVSYDKTMELRAKEGHYQGKKIPSMTEYVDSSLNDEAIKLAGIR